MDERAQGLILRTRLLTDTSLIVHWLTADQGRLATVAKGARRPKSPFAGKLDLFHLAEFSFRRSTRSDLHTLREVSLRHTHPALRTSLAALRQAAHAARLVEIATEPEAPVPELFDLLLQLLPHLASAGPAAPLLPNPLFAFELRLLHLLGFGPDPAQLPVSPGSRRACQLLLAAPWTEIARLRLSEAQIAELSRQLEHLLLTHLERVPPGRAAALRPQ